MHKDGVVIKVTDQYIVVLCSDGTFRNVKRAKDQFPLIGEKLALNQRKNAPSYGYYSIIAAIACAVLFMIFSPALFHKKDTPTAYVVAIDINPSIEIQVNKELYTIGLTALNKDGEKVIKAIGYNGKKLDETIDLIISQSVAYDFLIQKNMGLITTSIIPVNMDEKIDKNDVKSTIDRSLAKNEVYAEVQVSVDKMETMEAAHSLGLTVNKYKLYKILSEEGLPISTEEAKKFSVKDLLELVNKHHEIEDESNDVFTNMNQLPDVKDINLEQPTNLKDNQKPIEKNNTDTKNTVNVKSENPVYIDEKYNVSDYEDIDDSIEDEEIEEEEIDEDSDPKEAHDTIKNKLPIDLKDQENRVTDDADEPETEEEEDEDYDEKDDEP